MAILPEGGNAVGAALAGATPHRGIGGRPVAPRGLPAAEMLGADLKAYVLVGAIESGGLRNAGSGRSWRLGAADCVIALTPYAGAEQLADSRFILPIAAFAETSGTWVNVEGRWQSVAGAARPPGEARPGWKVLRVLANLLGVTGFDYLSSEDVRNELKGALDGMYAAPPAAGAFVAGHLNGVDKVRGTPIYRVDAVVRRSRPLQETRAGRAGSGIE